MKRLFLVFCLIFFSAAAVQATEITVGASSWFAGSYRYAGTTATLRIYYTQSFLSNTNVSVVGGAIGSSGWYKQVACTVSSNTLNCASFTFQSTIDSNKPSTRFFAVLYSQDGARRETLMGDASGWIVPASPTSTTVAQLQNAQGTGIPNPPVSYLNSTQVQALINTAIGTLNDAGAYPGGPKGRVYLSIAPDSATNPIAAGANTLITTTAPVRIDGGASADLSAPRTFSVNTFGSGASGVVPASGGGTTNFLRADGTWVAPIGGVTTVFGRSGAVVAVANDYTWAQIDKTTSSIADIATRSASDLSSGTLPDGRFPATLPAASGANLTALNATQLTSGTVPDARFPATLPAASGVNLTALNASNLSSGTVPDARFPATLPAASGVNLTALNASNLGSGTIPDARMPDLTGDVTTSAGAVATTIANDAVTYAKMQNVSAASRLLGRGDSGSGDPQEITLGTGLSMSGTTVNANTVSGTGTLNVIPRVTNATGPVYGDSAVSDDGTSVSSTRQFQILTTTTNFMRWTRDSSGNSKWLQTLLRPAPPSAALIVDATGNCAAGAHTFKVTYVTPAGETDASLVSNSVTCDAANTKVTLTIPTNNTATGYNTVATGRNIYATKVGDASTWYRIAASPVVANNIDTTYVFNIGDASFTATTAPTANTAIDARIAIDNLGNVGIGTSSPQFTDDGQGKSFVVEAGTGAAGYIGAGTSNMADVNSVVGMIAFYNLAMGGVDHRVGHVRGTNDGALGQGAIYIATSPNNVGSIDRIKVAYDGNVSIGNVSVAGGTLAVVALPAVTATGLFSAWYNNVGPTFLGGWYNNGNFHIGTETVPTANATHLLVFGPNGATDPTLGANTAAIYAKDVAGTVEMFAIDTGGGVTQLTIPYGSGVQTLLGTFNKANLNTALSDDDPAYLGTANVFTNATQTVSAATPVIILDDGTTNRGYFYHGANITQVAVNRNPVGGGFDQTGKAAAYINLTSAASDGNITFGTSPTNNTLPTVRLTITKDGLADFAVSVRSPAYNTTTNCADSAGAAACGAAAAGAVVIDAAATSVVVSTTAVTANSEIVIQEDSSLGTRLGVTCNTTIARQYVVTARTAATSFTITTSAAPITNPACLNYKIVN